jgi:iron complex outermembrane receptor protein
MRLITILLLAVAVILPGIIAQQSVTLRGTISNSEGTPVPNATVHVAGTRLGAVTSMDGEYEISLPSGDYRIEIAHTGYKKVEKTVEVSSDRVTELNIELVPSLFSIDQVVVTGSRGAEVSVRDLPASVSVVTSEEMVMKNVRTIDDALREIPGVHASRSQGFGSSGTHSGVNMRGTGDADRTLVLRNGIPLNSSYTGSVGLWNTTAACAVDRIEVVKGAASALYGSSAMGGVINMITDSPTLTPEIVARTEFGSYGSNLTGFKYTQAFPNRVGLMVSGEYKKSDGYQYRADDNWKEFYNKPKNETFNVTTKLEYSFRPGSKVSLDYEHHNENPLSGTTTAYDNEYVENRVVGKYEGITDKFSYSGALFIHRRNDTYHATRYSSSTESFSTPYYDGDIPKNETGFIGHVSTKFANNTLTLGTDIELGTTESDYMYHGSGQRYFQGEQLMYSLYLNDEISLGQHLDLSLGLRFDSWTNREGYFYDNTSDDAITINYPERDDQRVSPKAGAVYHINDNARLRASYSTGFKAPSLYYLYRSAPHGSTKFNLANPDLQPEIMNRSIDIGGDFMIADRLEVSLTYYNSNFEDFMYSSTVPGDQIPSYITPGEGVAVLQNINIGEVDLYGIEAAFKYSINDFWLTSLSYNYNMSEVKDHELMPEYVGNQLEDSPNHHLDIGINYSNPKIITAGIWMRTTGEQYTDEENSEENKIDGYTTFDVKVSRQIFDKVSLSIEAYNVFDNEYYSYYSSTSSYYYGPPRMVYVGLNYDY